MPLASLLDGNQSALNPQGPAATDIAALSSFLFAGAALIFIAVIAFTAYALLARPDRRRWMTRPAFTVAAGIVFPIVVLSALLVRALLPMAAASSPGQPPAVRIEVIGEQWWWRVHYLNADGSHDFATANEIRIPVGKRIELLLHSADVIHSFWVPNLAGKLDMIPGRVNRLDITADKAGEFRGQCAEYCGGPHALMAFHVIASSADEFEAWRAQQRQPGAVSTEAMGARGSQLFNERACGVCHRVNGTVAVATRGPDLTHVGSRRWLGAGTVRNTPGAMVDWIRASQHRKPQNLMPSFDMLPSDELAALGAYLETLQ